MDITELKTLLKNSTSVLVMENGRPDLVIMDYQAYRNLTKGPATDVSISKLVPMHGEVPHLPSHVMANSPAVLTPGDYTGLANHTEVNSPKSAALQTRETEILERLNREIMILKQQIELEDASQAQPLE